MGGMECNGKPYSLGLCHSPDHNPNTQGKQASYDSVVTLHWEGILQGRARHVGVFFLSTPPQSSKGHQSGYEPQTFIREWLQWFGGGWQLYGFEIQATVFTSVQVPQCFASCPVLGLDARRVRKICQGSSCKENAASCKTSAKTGLAVQTE